MIDAGNETVDNAIVSCIFRLKQFPEIYEKLMSELKKCKISSAVFQKKLDKDLISDCDYLTYVVKESLRMDPPSMSTSPYYTYEDVEICNVKIPANTNIVLSVCKYSFLIKNSCKSL